MSVLATSRDETIQNDGHVYIQPSVGLEFVEKTLPTGVVGVRVRPTLLKYQERVYILGQFSTPLVVTETQQVWSMGIPAPSSAAVMALGAGSGGSVGEAIGYLTFVEFDSGVLVHESNPSEASATVMLNGEGRSWTSIPTVSVNQRVTHVRGYVSMDGSLPGLAWERDLGVTTVTENVPTSQLGERLPVIVSSDGELDLDISARGVPPNGSIGEFYHDALWISGDYNFPTRIYYSKLFEPESFDTVDKDRGWFETLDGESVTGLQRWGDLLIVGCLRAAYAIQGFDSGDYQMIKLTNSYGVISHHSMRRTGPNADLWAAGQEGPWMYNGAFHDLFENDLRDYWRNDYENNTTAYEDSLASEDKFFRTYQLLIPFPNSTTFKYVCHWLPVIKAGNPPWVVFDQRNRVDTGIGQVIIADDDHFTKLLSGSDDGFIRQENYLTDASDDNDAALKALTITTKHFFFRDQAGDDAHGRSYEDLDVFIKNESTAVTVSAYAGDDSANQASSPQWSRVIPIGAVSLPQVKVPKTSTHFSNISECNGKGITLKFTANSPVNVGLRGYAIYYVLGHQERPVG